MTAELWIEGKVCRVVVYDDAGNAIDENNQWNNRASAEAWVLTHYPLARIEFLHSKGAK